MPSVPPRPTSNDIRPVTYDERRICFYREGKATSVNMSSSTLSNQFIPREGEAGEAPAESWRRQLGRSLALPNEDSLVSKASLPFRNKFSIIHVPDSGDSFLACRNRVLSIG